MISPKWYATRPAGGLVDTDHGSLTAAVRHAQAEADRTDRSVLIYEGDDPWPTDRIEPRSVVA